MKLEVRQGDKIAVLIWYQDGDIKNVKMFIGNTHYSESGWAVVDENRKVNIPLSDDLLKRIKIPSDDIREIVSGASYMLSLSIADLHKSEDPTTYLQTGLNWNEL